MSKDAIRQAMPTVAALVDEFRSLMTNGGRVIFASENGHTLDRREPVNPESIFDVPQGYAPMREVAKKEKR